MEYQVAYCQTGTADLPQIFGEVFKKRWVIKLPSSWLCMKRYMEGNADHQFIVQKIHRRLETTQSRQKRYADKRRKPLEFSVGDSVFLKVAPMKGVMCFEKKGKLIPRYIGPFEMIERIEKVAYRLALSPNLASVHNVFHVAMLLKYISDPSHALQYEPIQIREDLSYEEQPVQILAQEEKKLRSRSIPIVKVQWKNHSVAEATWEVEEEIGQKCPHLF
ncbi:uncharacterized protein LOC112092212 [Morus notabilis]|uniref:uncharacterized protein LOC112092212 n=1 Tax=Morus notabilis TaxID=981085 RepID=UPI000CED4201|nr:uncharacterized protein LOC112092212 [Morus notabilis]